MRLVIDVDGVLADFTLGFTRIANRLFGIPVCSGLNQSAYGMECLMPPEQAGAVWDEIVHSPLFWRDLDPIASVGELHRLGDLRDAHDLYFVTDRGGVKPKIQTEGWLRRFGIARPTVIVSPAKGELAKAIRADALLDDKAGNVVFTQYHSPNTAVYLVDRPYNLFDSAVLGSKIARVRTLGEFLDNIEDSCRLRTSP